MTGKSLLARPGLRALLSLSAAVLLRVLGATWRIRIEGPDPFVLGTRPKLAAMWHRDLLIAAYLFRDRDCTAIVSQSRDGDLIDALLRRLGFAEAPRGSSSRGGFGAMRQATRILASGKDLSLQVDGPRGPARQSKIGIAILSRLSGVPIIPVTLSASPCFRFRSWDRTLLPLPFARVTCRYGESLGAPKGRGQEEEEAVCHALDARLNDATDELDRGHGLGT